MLVNDFEVSQDKIDLEVLCYLIKE